MSISVYLLLSVSVYLSLSISVYLYLSIYPSIVLFIYLSFCLSVYLYKYIICYILIYIFLYLYTYFCFLMSAFTVISTHIYIDMFLYIYIYIFIYLNKGIPGSPDKGLNTLINKQPVMIKTPCPHAIGRRYWTIVFHTNAGTCGATTCPGIYRCPRRALQCQRRQELAEASFQEGHQAETQWPTKGSFRDDLKAQGNGKFGHNTFQNIDRLVDTFFSGFTHLNQLHMWDTNPFIWCPDHGFGYMSRISLVSSSHIEEPCLLLNLFSDPGEKIKV